MSDIRRTREECLTAASDDFLNPEMEGMEIHPNEIKDSWNDPINKIHFDTYMDGTTQDLPLTQAEIKAETLYTSKKASDGINSQDF